MIPTLPHSACIILSGGVSSRMKMHKALLRFNENETFLEHILHIYQQAGIEKIVVVKFAGIETKLLKENFPDVLFIENHQPEKGKLHSLRLGLQTIHHQQYCFIQTIDNPLVNAALLNQLYKSRHKAHYISPAWGGKGGHPILISAPVMEHFRHPLPDDRNLHDELQRFSRERVETNTSDCLANINTVADYDAFIHSQMMTTAP